MNIQTFNYDLLVNGEPKKLFDLTEAEYRAFLAELDSSRSRADLFNWRL